MVAQPFLTALTTFKYRLVELSRRKDRKIAWTIRGTFGLALILYFCLTVYCGPVLIMATTIAIQVKCFKEVLSIAIGQFPEELTDWIWWISSYFLITFNLFVGGELSYTYFRPFLQVLNLNFLEDYHMLISFFVYITGIIGFVLSLKKNCEAQQYNFLAWTHMSLMLFAIPCYMTVKDIFQGMIWIIMAVTFVTFNDISAYIFGNLMGKTPLIEISPKKTWEGFVGAAISTLAYSQAISYVLCKYPFLTCPIQYKLIRNSVKMVYTCEVSDLFMWKTIEFLGLSLGYYPCMYHAFVVALFSCFLAPFGGFFASGFKRTYKVKDFASTIPGHGGILDRFNCFFPMVSFLNVYLSSFVSKPDDVEIVMEIIDKVAANDQVKVFRLLENHIIRNLNITNVDMR